MIKSQSKGRIPVLKNGAEADKVKPETSGKAESARPKLFGSKSKNDKKDAEKAKKEAEKAKKAKQLAKYNKEKEEKEKKKMKEKDKTAKDKPEKEKKKLFKSPLRSKSSIPQSKTTKAMVSSPVTTSPTEEATSNFEFKIFGHAKERFEEDEVLTVSDSVLDTPSPEPQYEVVASPKKRAVQPEPLEVVDPGDSNTPKEEVTTPPSFNESLVTSSESIDVSLQDSVLSYDFTKGQTDMSYDTREDNSGSSRGDYSSGSRGEYSSGSRGEYSGGPRGEYASSSRGDNTASGYNQSNYYSSGSLKRGYSNGGHSEYSYGRRDSEDNQGNQQYYEAVGPVRHYQLTETMSEEERGQDYDQVGYKECPRSPSARSDPGVLEDTPAKPNRIRHGPGRRSVPRRHTVAHNVLNQDPNIEEPEDKRAAFMELLAHRYPAYADRIYSGTQSEVSYPVKPSRSRDPRRRQTTIVTYHPNRSLEYDDSGTMSDLDAPSNSFSRGGVLRSSLPIVRTPSSTLDRTLGLAFLVYGTETKKCLLPNEITTLDTVRALFVRAFPERLTFEFLESPRQKIYILDPKTNIFFQLDDLSDVKDRAVLRIHECDSDKPQKLKDQPRVRGRAISAPPEKQYGRHIPPHGEYGKLPPQPYHTMRVDVENHGPYESERRSRSRSRTPDPDRPKSLPNRARYSPERHPTPERGLLGTIPENRQLQNGRPNQNGGSSGPYDAVYYPRPHSQPNSPTRTSRPFSPTTGYDNPYYGYHAPPASHGDYYAPHNGNMQPYMSKPGRAPPQHVAVLQPQPDPRNGTSRHPSSNRHSLAFAPMTANRPPPENYYQRPVRHRPMDEEEAFAQSRSATPVPEYYHSKKRIDKMEVQLANLAAWVQKSATDSLGRRSCRSNSSNASESSETLPISSSSKSVRLKLDYTGMSGISDGGSSQRTSHTITCTNEMRLSMVAIKEKTCNLRLELRGLRRAQQVNYEDICEAINNTLKRIKHVLMATPGACSQLIRQQRYEMDSKHSAYMTDKRKLEHDLSDLEQSVEELRNDVVSRQCRVQMCDIEAMALLLSNITKSIADLKSRFPRLQENMKTVMAGEMEVVVTEEKFLKEEPERIESSLKRCKKLTGTLYTLKRLASVQDHRPLNVPAVATKSSEPANEVKHDVLENIRAIVPNHRTRLNSLEEAENSRERKKKILQQQEALKFGKSLEIATKSLKPAEDKQKEGSGFDPIVSVAASKVVSAGKPNIAYSSQVTSMPVKSVPSQPEKAIHQDEKKQADVAASIEPSPKPIEDVTAPKQSDVIVPPSQTVTLPTMAVPASPTTVMTQEVTELNNQKMAARAAFFSSLSSPESSSPASPASDPSPTSNQQGNLKSTEPGAKQAKSVEWGAMPANSSSKISNVAAPVTTMDYVVKFTPAQVTSINTESGCALASATGTQSSTTPDNTYRPSNLTKSPPSPKDQLSPTQKTSIPRPSGKTSPSSDHHPKSAAEGKVKKQPPPPPPRKSSRLPLGAHNVNGTVSPVRPFSPENPPAEVKPANTDPKHPVVYSSTPKPILPKKPVSKYQKDLMAGIYANMNRPDLQSQKSPPQHDKLPSQPETKTNVLFDREGSSDSTSSSASYDSQIGGAVLRNKDGTGSNGSINRKSKTKPNPPERRSSLLSKSPTRTGDEKTQLLQDQTLLLSQLEQQQSALLQQHSNLVRSTNNPPPTLPKPTSPVHSQNTSKK